MLPDFKTQDVAAFGALRVKLQEWTFLGITKPTPREQAGERIRG